MKKILITITFLGVIYGCCKDPINPCDENTRVRFHNGSGIDLDRIQFFGNNIGTLLNDETSNYIIVNSDTLQSDGRDISNDFLTFTLSNHRVSTKPLRPHDFSSTPNCFTYVITGIDTVNVFNPETLFYTILLE